MGNNSFSKERFAGALLLVLVGFAVVSIVVNAMLYSMGGHASGYISQPLSAGKPAPAFELASLSGDTVSLEQFKGDPVLIMFWGTS